MKQHKRALAVWIGVTLVLLAGALLAGTQERPESVQAAMRDAVLHDINQIGFFGGKAVRFSVMMIMRIGLTTAATYWRL